MFSVTERLIWKRSNALLVVSTENLKNLKYHTSSKKTLVIFVIWSKCKNEVEKIFKEEESIEISKIIGLIKKYNYFRNMVEENISQ